MVKDCVHNDIAHALEVSNSLKARAASALSLAFNSTMAANNRQPLSASVSPVSFSKHEENRAQKSFHFKRLPQTGPLSQIPPTCWSPHSNSPPPAGLFTQIPHHLLVSSLKFPTSCWPPHSNSSPPAGLLTQIPPHSNSPPCAGLLTQIPHHLLIFSLKFPTTCWSPHSNSPPPAGLLTQIPHLLLTPSLKLYHLLVSSLKFPSLKFPTTCWSPHSNSPPPAGPLTQNFPSPAGPSLKFPTTCWSPHSNSPPPAGPLTQIPHHLLVPSLIFPTACGPTIKHIYRTFCCAAIFVFRSCRPDRNLKVPFTLNVFLCCCCF